MIFEIGKTYRHNTGKRMTIIGRLKTHIYGECLIGEWDTGELVTVGESEENAVNWYEQESEDNEWKIYTMICIVFIMKWKIKEQIYVII